MNSKKVSKDNLTGEINTKLSEVIAHICRNPLSHVSETDIHFLVMHKLAEIPELDPFVKKGQYDTGCTIGKNNKGISSNKMYKTMRMHKEYGHQDIKNARRDIVIFDKDSASKIIDPINLKSDSGYLRPEYIFEFGTEKSVTVTLKEESRDKKHVIEVGQDNEPINESTLRKHLKNDFNKIKEAAKCGYIINIYRNVTKTERGTSRFEQNSKKIEKCIGVEKEFVNSNCLKNVKYLLFHIEIGNEVNNLKYKVRMYRAEDKDFKEINQEELEQKIFDELQG